MRHRWMVMLVVMVTTLTTAQEALKQYDGLRAQAQGWATLRLLTGFINAYTPQDDSTEAQAVVTCSASQLRTERAHPLDAPAQEARFLEAQITVKRDAANQLAGVESLIPEAGHHNDSPEVPESEFERIGEVAMLAETVEVLPEEPGDDVEEPAEFDDFSDDSSEEVATLHTLRDVRHTDRALNRDLTVIAPRKSDTASPVAALHKARLASRTEAQLKARTIRRALKVIQIQIEKAAKVELRTDSGDLSVELPNEIVTAQLAPESTGGIAARYPLTMQGLVTGQATVSTSGGECAGE